MKRKWVVYFILFLTIFVILGYGYYQSISRGTFVSRVFIDDLTVRPAGAIINVIFPSASAKAIGHSLVSRFVVLNILEGCEGAEGMFLLIAAVIPYPAPWRFRLIGLFFGVLLMYVLNLMRVVALFVLLRWHPQWFGTLHAVIAPTAIVLLGGLFFLWWVNAVARSQTALAS